MSSVKIIVSKFGGTSMGDAACMLRSAEVSYQQKSSMVLVSATSGTTNQLIELGRSAQGKSWEDVEVLVQKIQDRHSQIARELGTPLDSLHLLYSELESLSKGIYLLRDCSPRAMDALMSLGERMSSVLFSFALKKVFQSHQHDYSVRLIDIRDYMLTDNNFGSAKPFIEKIESAAKALQTKLNTEKVVFVAQGYIGKTEEGQTTTLGRGGSDYSAAIMAEALHADELEIWTDVAGIATTDPRMVPEAKPIDEISFKEASELAIFGAKVLHPATLLPAMRKNIPTFVGSSFAPQEKGTWIRKEVDRHPLIRAMALRKKQALVTITTPEMLNAYGFLFQIFKIFNDHKVSIDSITTSEISVAVTLDESTLENKNLISDLEKIAEVSIEKDLSLVSLIGNNINHTPGLAKRVFESITDVNVRMICLGASKHNFCFLVSENQGTTAIQKLHKAFLEN